ncbi:DMT family transporter [Sphingomonas sanxanigenens]|nr:DMT family transporter [Sphingomonas sanxanigenens]
MILGLLGVLVFSGSMPATRAAVAAFDPAFLTAARALIAAAAGAVPILLLRSRPAREDIRSLALVSLCVVLAFPLLSAMALTHISSPRAILFTGLLPVVTATWSVLRGGERPRAGFWLFAFAGAALLIGYALLNGAATGSGMLGDALMLASIILCGLGYAEGAVLTRRMGGWQVICWALLLAAPAMALLAWWLWPATLTHVAPSAWLGLAYVSLFSMLIGFVFWYRGLALGGAAAVGQLQLLQPIMGFAVSAVLLGEQIGWPIVAAALCLLLCVGGARRFA